MCSYINSCYIYTVHLSPALNGSSEIQHFECSDMIEYVTEYYMHSISTRGCHMQIIWE